MVALVGTPKSKPDSSILGVIKAFPPILTDRLIADPPGPVETGVLGEFIDPDTVAAEEVNVMLDMVELIPVLIAAEAGKVPDRLFLGAEPEEREVEVEPVLRRFIGGGATSGV